MNSQLSNGLAPILSNNARLLILGSMPGQASLAAQEYYAHPRNLFWPLMQSLFQIDASAAYPQRLAALTARGILLWDVIQHCQRVGSLDSQIQTHSIQINNFAELLQHQPNLRCIAFNGQKAAQIFQQRVQTQLRLPTQVQLLCLPSTSPANASQSYCHKLQAWQQLLRFSENQDF